MMMKFPPLEETEGYKSMIREATDRGMSHSLIRMAHRRFPDAGQAVDEAISELDYLQLERLADAILDLPDLVALRAWLVAEAKQ